MKTLLLAAALSVVGGMAHADQSFSFEIDGRTIRIERPADCTDLSCLSVSIPGIYESRPNRGRRSNDEAARDTDSAPPAPEPAPQASSPAPATPPATANGQPAPASAQATAAAPQAPSSAAARAPDAPAENTPPAPAAPAAGEPAKPAIAAVTATPAIQGETAAPAAKPVADTPVGLWLTEKKEGRVRIEPCGSNLCGYEVSDKTNANGRKVLIDMAPQGDKWAGRIRDPKGGGNYDSTIALKGPDRLQVQGCAFGGLFCGGQTWTRVE